MLKRQEYLDKILEESPLMPRETVALDDALGRFAAQSCLSGMAVPPLDNSAVDGYALRLEDWDSFQAPGSSNFSASLPLKGRFQAGDPPGILEKGTCARIFTGAPIPLAADAVIMQEDCRVMKKNASTQILFQRKPQKGEAIRRRGLDIEEGTSLLSPGQRIDPQHAALLASVGQTKLEVFAKPRVAILITGNELLMPGESLSPGKIFNSNYALLSSLLQRLGVEVLPFMAKEIVADSPEATRRALQEAAALADLVVSTGGVSVGEEDYVKNAVESLGRLILWRVAVKPGKPLVYGWVKKKPFFGLPGNPVSVFISSLLFLRPYLLKMQGHENSLPPSFPLPLAEPLKAGNRDEFFRVSYESGSLCSARSQSSAALSGLVEADGLAFIPANQERSVGSEVAFYPFSSFF